MRLIWSFGETERDNIVYHGTTNRGTKSVQLLTGAPPPDDNKILENAEPLDFRMRNVSSKRNAIILTTCFLQYNFLLFQFSLPSSKKSYYRCEMFKIPNYNKRRHIIAVININI